MLRCPMTLLLVLSLAAAGCVGAPEESTGQQADAAGPEAVVAAPAPAPDALEPEPESEPAASNTTHAAGETAATIASEPSDPPLEPQAPAGPDASADAETPAHPQHAESSPEPAQPTEPTPAPAPAEQQLAPDPALEPEPEPVAEPEPASEPEPTAAPEPDAEPPAEEPEAWPREGSHVVVRGSAGQSIPSTFDNTSEWEARWTYRDGDWHGACEGTWEHRWENGTIERGTFARALEADGPPHWPLFDPTEPPEVGEEVEVWVMWDCDIRSERMIYSGTEDHEAHGRVHTADDEAEAEAHYSDFDTAWDPDTGLVLSWDWARSHSDTRGELVSTDAPVHVG